jgi:hypothetical protein
MNHVSKIEIPVEEATAVALSDTRGVAMLSAGSSGQVLLIR